MEVTFFLGVNCFFFFLFLEQTAGECTACNLKCPTFNDLSVHYLKNHTEQSPCPSPMLKCTSCDCAFKNMLGFKLHLMRIHLNAPNAEVGVAEELRCQSCDKVFTTKQGLTIHTATIHSDIRNFACTLCPLKFKQSGHLKVHLTTHSDRRDFKCNQCSADFKLQSTLNKHLRNHLKPGYVYRMPMVSDQGMLIARRPRQRRIKDENENHECPTCGKVFKFKCSLEKHMQTHSDLRNFICPLCAMAFKSNQHLQTHFKKHQKKSFMKYKCSICASICKNQFTLRKHMKLHSGKDGVNEFVLCF
jgi:KRAB domain-containing zinc finger protein